MCTAVSGSPKIMRWPNVRKRAQLHISQLRDAERTETHGQLEGLCQLLGELFCVYALLLDNTSCSEQNVIRRWTKDQCHSRLGTSPRAQIRFVALHALVNGSEAIVAVSKTIQITRFVLSISIRPYLTMSHIRVFQTPSTKHPGRRSRRFRSRHREVFNIHSWCSIRVHEAFHRGQGTSWITSFSILLRRKSTTKCAASQAPRYATETSPSVRLKVRRNWCV